jgi:outer membrane protein assembly factor BamD
VTVFPRYPSLLCRVACATLVAAACAALPACGPGLRRGTVPPGTVQPDQYLYDKGMAALKDKKWLTAREYFTQINDNYAQSALRPDAMLAIGDTDLGQGTSEALVFAINEFEEFLSYYPTNARADYAQYKLALAHVRQMRNPERDQTETREAIAALEKFVTRYPQSTLMPEVKTKLREAHDRLSTSDYLVGYFYFRNKWYPGAVERFVAILRDDPDYTQRDGVYFYLAESMVQLKREAEALTYYERLVKEFQQSEYLKNAKLRIADLKAKVQAAQ